MTDIVSQISAHCDESGIVCRCRYRILRGAGIEFFVRVGYRILRCRLGEDTEKKKGCDIGNALAADSCEGAGSVDTCTVTALDAVTAFAVPNPGCSSQGSRFFRVRLPGGLSRQADRPAYFGLANVT